MSTRYMKKVYGGDVLIEKDSENESEVENSIIGAVKSKTFNVFDLVRFKLLQHYNLLLNDTL